MTISTDQLISFVTVAESGSIAQAARELGKSRATVSESLSNLEIDLGFELFDRSRRDITLTSQAQSLLAQAKIAVIHLARLTQLSEAITADEESEFTIIYDGHIPSQPISALVILLKKEFPLVRINLNRQFGETVKSALLNAEADLAFCLSDATDKYADVSYKHIAMMPLVYLAANSHPMQGKKCGVEELSCYPQILLGGGYSEAFMETAVISSNWSSVSSLDILQEILSNTDSWVILARSDAEKLIADGQCSDLKPQFLAVEPLLPVDALWQRDMEMGVVKRRAIEICRKCFSSL